MQFLQHANHGGILSWLRGDGGTSILAEGIPLSWPDGVPLSWLGKGYPCPGWGYRLRRTWDETLDRTIDRTGGTPPSPRKGPGTRDQGYPLLPDGWTNELKTLPTPSFGCGW